MWCLDYFSGIGVWPGKQFRWIARAGHRAEAIYFELSCRFLAEMELQLAQPQMFTLEELEAA
jgi:hypothetical protein